MIQGSCFKISFLTCLFVHVASFGFAQVIRGQVVDHATSKPIMYVNIGISGSPVGTISNEDGTFSITVLSQYSEDSLSFSMLGYAPKSFSIRQIVGEKNILIVLEEKATKLETVTITAKKGKAKGYRLGNRYNKGGLIYGDSTAAGSAMALLIENKYPTYHEDLKFPAYALEASLFISRNTMDTFKVRLRFLSRHPVTGLPDHDLFNESMILTSSVRHGWITFDLKPYQLVIRDNSFFLAFEWIIDERDRLNLIRQYKEYQIQNPEMVTADTMMVAGEKVGFRSYHRFHVGTSFGVSPIPFSLQNYTCYYRTNSFGKWMRAPGVLTARLYLER